jgi:hypothetical protein
LLWRSLCGRGVAVAQFRQSDRACGDWCWLHGTDAAEFFGFAWAGTAAHSIGRCFVSLAAIEITTFLAFRVKAAIERAPLLISSNRLDYCLFSILHSIWQTKASIRDENSEMHVMDNSVLRKVTALPEEYRAAAFLAYVEHRSYREVANVPAVPASTATSRLHAPGSCWLKRHSGYESGGPIRKGQQAGFSTAAQGGDHEGGQRSPGGLCSKLIQT